MSFYARTRASANRMIAKYGATATLVHVAKGTLAADMASRTGDTTTRTQTKVVVLDYENKQIDGTRIIQGDRRGIMLAETNPEVGDTIEVNGETLKVIIPRPVKPGGTVIYHEAQLRR